MLRVVGIMLVVLIAADSPLFSQQADFHIGFKTFHLYDSSRRYKPNVPISDSLHFRPIDVDVWYPAEVSSSDAAMKFVDLVQLLESRTKFYDQTQSYTGITEELLQYICAGLECPNYHVLKKINTESYANAIRLKEPYPLVLYFAGLNGMSFENYLLFESLAGQGFVVACISSMGRYPGNMTMEFEDIEEQVRDGKFVMHFLAEQKWITHSIGLCGYSWGGLAATLLASEQTGAYNAVVSLNGSERFHYYGDEDDEHLTRMRNTKQFKPEEIRSPYLYMDSDLEISEHLPDSIYNIQEHLTCENIYLRIKGAAHEDFSSISAVQGEKEKRFHLIEKLAVAFFSDNLKHTNIFQKEIQSELVSIIPSPKSNPTTTGSTILLRGIVRDQKTNEAIPYVNVGVIHKDVGTASTRDGEFKLNITNFEDTDSLKISSVGYSSKVFSLKDLQARKSNYLTIQLPEKTDELQEVVVHEKKITLRTFGNKTESKFFGGKFASDDFGSEMAIRINIPKKPFYITKFQFNVSYNTGDSSNLRLNLYTVENSLPGQNILQKNILVRLGKTTGKIEVDLSKYNIVMQDDFFISLEYIEGNSNTGIVFSSGFINKGTYYRKSSHGRWRKYPMGIGFSMTGYH